MHLNLKKILNKLEIIHLCLLLNKNNKIQKNSLIFKIFKQNLDNLKKLSIKNNTINKYNVNNEMIQKMLSNIIDKLTVIHEKNIKIEEDIINRIQETIYYIQIYLTYNIEVEV